MSQCPECWTLSDPPILAFVSGDATACEWCRFCGCLHYEQKAVHRPRQTATNAYEERMSWDKYAAASIHYGGMSGADRADDMLLERRRRFAR